jgi:hypothetical protein
MIMERATLTVLLTVPMCLVGQQSKHVPRISASVPFAYPTRDVVGRHIEYSVATAVDFATATVFAYSEETRSCLKR